MINLAQPACERIIDTGLALSGFPHARSTPPPEMGFKMSAAERSVADALNEADFFLPIFGQRLRFPKKGDKKSVRRYYNDLAQAALVPGGGSATLCRGPRARHGKEQQVVSCPPRRWRPDRLSLRSVRSSVERHALAGGDAPPTPSRDKTSAPASAIPTTIRRRHIPQGRHALGTPMRGTSDQRQTQAWGTVR